jgi:hypothetical protein
MKYVAYYLTTTDFEDRLEPSIGASPRYGQSIKALEGVLEVGSLSRREDLDDCVEQSDGMPSYPEVYESSHGGLIAVCTR